MLASVGGLLRWHRVAPGAMSTLAVAVDLQRGTLVRVEVAQVDLGRTLRAVWAVGQEPPAGPARELVALAVRTSGNGDHGPGTGNPPGEPS